MQPLWRFSLVATGNVTYLMDCLNEENCPIRLHVLGAFGHSRPQHHLNLLDSP